MASSKTREVVFDAAIVLVVLVGILQFNKQRQVYMPENFAAQAVAVYHETIEQASNFAEQAAAAVYAISSNASIIKDVPYVDIPYVGMAAMQDVTSTGDMELPDIMDETVRLLLPPKRAEEYIRQHPSHNFSFFVYDDLPSELRWQHNSKCLETKLNIPHWQKGSSGQISNCDWGSSICTQVNSSNSKYSSRRFNRNGDVVMAKLLLEDSCPLRTYDPTKADVFIVPYPSSAHCACHNSQYDMWSMYSTGTRC
jgi:hypothetical protein